MSESIPPLLPIAMATAALMVAGLFPAGRLKWPVWARSILNVALFVAVLLLVPSILDTAWTPPAGASTAQVFWTRLIRAGWWLLGARICIDFGRFLLVVEHRPREARLLSDLATAAIYCATLLAIIDLDFGLPLGGVLATSGVIAIVLGLALQNTLADVFAGIAVGVARPYEIGDSIWVEGGIEGRVVEVNWRSTLIATGQNNVAVIPNSVMAKSRLVNLSSPTEIRRDTVSLRLDVTVSTDYCRSVLAAAVRACRLPLSHPAAEICCTGLYGDGATYEISFSIANGAGLEPARNELFSHIQRHLRYAGIGIAVAGVGMPTDPPPSVPGPLELLLDCNVFHFLDEDLRSAIAAKLKSRKLKVGEVILRQDDPSHALYLIAAGTIEVTRIEKGASHVVTRLSPGDSVGAVGLLTGAHNAATATALTLASVYFLERTELSETLAAHPKLQEVLDALARRGEEMLQQDSAAHREAAALPPGQFLDRVRAFLKLKG
ncbi:MAG TPA: mechanosensitive ion channel family protein [Aliidongia sp.]|nr:mechanosensitive ion channel family protein [Aliidongia sp.]